MKRFILVMFVGQYDEAGDYAPAIRKIQTNDLTNLITKLAEDGHDIGVEVDDEDKALPESVDEVTGELIQKGHFDVGDGAWALTLIDMEKVDEFEDLDG